MLFGLLKTVLSWPTRKLCGLLLSVSGRQPTPFVTLNGELGFSSKDIKDVTCLPILGELYEEYFPAEVELTAESEEFRTLFFQVLGFYEYLKVGRGSPKTFEWHNERHAGTEGKSNFFLGNGFYRNVKKKGTTANYPSNFSFHHRRDFLKQSDEKFPNLVKRRDLALHLGSLKSFLSVARARK